MANILIVDDEPQVSALLSAVLVGAGHEVQTVTTPQAAIEMCGSQGCFDLVLSEVHLPVMDGHELARWIASRCPNSRTVLVSSAAMGCDDCPYATYCAFIRKPFRPKEVLATVTSVLAAPAQRKCVVAQLLLDNYSAALKDFYGFPDTILDVLRSGTPDEDATQKKTGTAYVGLLAARAEYRTHIREHGCRPPARAMATYQQIHSRLGNEVLRARAAFDSASDKLHRLTLLSSESETGPEEKHVLEQARRVHHAAHQVYAMTLQRLGDFLRDELFPVDKGSKPS